MNNYIVISLNIRNIIREFTVCDQNFNLIDE